LFLDSIYFIINDWFLHYSFVIVFNRPLSERGLHRY
jgi:hypothetical protein